MSVFNREERDLWDSTNGHVPAIIAHRKRTGAGLKEAVEAAHAGTVETWADDANALLVDFHGVHVGNFGVLPVLMDLAEARACGAAP